MSSTTIQAEPARTAAQPVSRVRSLNLLLIMIAVTSVLSLLYALQYYLGGPLRIPVTTPINDVALVPGGTILAAARQDGQIQVWDAGQNWTGRLLKGHDGPVTGLVFVPQSYTLITAGRDGTIRQWNAVSSDPGQILASTGGPLNGLSLSGDGSTLATVGADGHLRLWDVREGQFIRDIEGGSGVTRAVAASPDGRLVAAGDGANIQIWDVRSGVAGQRFEGQWRDPQEKDTWLGHRKPVTALAFSPDGTLLASGAADATMAFWSVEDGTFKWQSEGNYGPVTAIAFNSDGTQVITGSADTKVRTWRIPGGSIIAPYVGHVSAVTSVAFGNDPTTLYSAAADGSVRTWETLNQKTTHVEWTNRGLQPSWGKLLTAWMLISGLLGLLAVWGLRRVKRWGHMLALALFLVGPTAVLGLPLLDTFPFYYAGIVLRFVGYELAALSLLAQPFLILGVLACFIIVLVKLFRDEDLAHFLPGVFVPFYAYAWGWRKAGWLRLRRIMVAWTIMGLAALALAAVQYLARGFLIPMLKTPGVTFVAGNAGTVAGDFSPAARLLITLPLLILGGWYAFLVFGLMREHVAERYAAPGAAALADQLMLRHRTHQLRLGLFGLAVWIGVLVLLYSILRRFNLDISFMRHFFSFIMTGAGVTLGISALSILLAIFLALLGALGRLSANPIANGISSFYISLIRGTPLLVQVYVWYLGLPRLNITLPAIVCGVLALGVNYGAYMSETFRAGIQAIGKGQHEAAHALGMTSGQTFRRIVLPQAFRIVIPPIGNDFIAMMKDSSLVSLMAVMELTWRAQKLGRQYFRSMETLIVAAAFYWLLTVVFQFLQGKLETYLARSERR